MSSLTAFLEAIDGIQVGDPQSSIPVLCDSCGLEINPGETVGCFYTDPTISGSRPTPNFFRVHCRNCEIHELVTSATGYAEFLVHGTFTEDDRVVDPEIVDYSGTNDGIPYDPLALIDEFLPLSRAEIERKILPAGDIVGPQDVMYHLIGHGIDPEEILDETTGEFTITDEQRELFMRHLLQSYEDGLTGPLRDHYERKYGPVEDHGV